jgi:hypothetical protein
LVERNLAKVEVGSSSLLSRSSFRESEVISGSDASLELRLKRDFVFPFFFSRQHTRRGGRVVMQRPAKPWTPVRFRPPPPYMVNISVSPNFISWIPGIGTCAQTVASQAQYAGALSARMVKLVDTRDLKSLDLKQVVPVRFRLRAPDIRRASHIRIVGHLRMNYGGPYFNFHDRLVAA